MRSKTLLITESIQRNMRLADAIFFFFLEVAGSGIPTAIRDCIDCQTREPTVEFKRRLCCRDNLPLDDWQSASELEAKRGIPESSHRGTSLSHLLIGADRPAGG